MFILSLLVYFVPKCTETVPTGNLPPHCFDPRGENCNWYRECLERRYQCEGTNHGYAIEYGEKFCNLYSMKYNDFTTDGKNWVNEVRKCLQVALVPSLDSRVMKTCEEIRRVAFKSHPSCYVTPDSGVPGICELPGCDVWKAFSLVLSESRALLSAISETIQQALRVVIRCIGRRYFDTSSIQKAHTSIRVTVKGFVCNSVLPAKLLDHIATGQN